VKCIHLFLCNKYGIRQAKRLRTHSVQEIAANADFEIRVDTTVAISTKQQANRPDLVVIDKWSGPAVTTIYWPVGWEVLERKARIITYLRGTVLSRS